MEINQATALIKNAFMMSNSSETWADVGAGTGIFTEALQVVLPPESNVYALDKNPHVLWSLQERNQVKIQVQEGNFEQTLDLPPLDGILMANALHYTAQPISVIKNLLTYLKPKGKFLLIEYDTEKAQPPWVPYPVSWKKWQEISQEVGLSKPELIAESPSHYGYQRIYVAQSFIALA